MRGQLFPRIISGLTAACVVTTLGVMAAPVPARSDALWTTTTDLSVAGQDSAEPQIAASADGNRLTAVWYRYNGAHWLIQSSRSSDGGVSWSVPADLSSADEDSRWPQVVASADGMRVTCVWQGWDGAVRVASSSDAGGTWSHPIELAPGGMRPQVSASADGLRLTAVWELGEIVGIGTWFIQARSSTDGGASWSAPVRVYPDGGVVSWSDLAQVVSSDSGMRLTAAWLAGMHKGVQAGSSSDGGATWTPVDVSAIGNVVWKKDLSGSSDGRRLTIVWVDLSAYVVKASSSSDFGATWTTPVDLSGVPADDPQVVTSADGSRVTAVWMETTKGVQARSSSDGGATWTIGPVTPPGGELGSTPQVAGSDDGMRLALAWMAQDSSYNYQVYAGSSSDGGASWGSSLLSSDVQYAGQVQIAGASDGGRITAVWVRSNGSNFIVQSRSRAVAPTLSAVSPPSGPSAGGTSVVLTGTGFGGTHSVTFGGTPAAFRVESATRISATTPAGTPGSVAVSVATPYGFASLPGAFTYVAPPPTDVTPPVTRMVTPTTPVAWSTTIRMTFSGRDVGGAVASYQVQRAVKAPGGALGGYANFGGPRSTASVTMTGAKPGYGYCFRVRGTDTAGNTSGWSGAACQTMPGDDRALAGRGWSRVSSRTAYLRTLTVSRTKGATLVLPKSRGSYLTLVVNKVPGGGTLGVYVKGKKVATVPTTARRAALKVVVMLKVRTAGVPVVLRLDAPGSRGVSIDGIAQLP